MRLARKLFLLAVMAFAALAMTATTASAQVHVEEEVGLTRHDCPTMIVNVHSVTGGCHVEFESEEHIPLIVQTAGGPVTISNCTVHLEARLREDGTGWVTAVELMTETVPTNPPCTRAACDEASGALIPWPIAIAETGAGTETAEATFCLRTIASGPGGAGTSCEVHLPLTSPGGHVYEAGIGGSHSCENQPAISIADVHLETVANIEEDIEIIH